MPTTSSAGRSGSRRKSSEEKYEAILEAALALFVERGFHGTAVPQVARRAGVAAGTIYTHFPNKEALVNTLYRRWKQAIATIVYHQFPVTAPPREQFQAMWNNMSRFALEHSDAFAFLELHHHGSYLDAESRAMENSLKEFGAGYIPLAQSSGVFKPMDTTLLMELMFGAFIGMMRAHYEGRITLDSASLAQAEQACWDAIAAKPDGS
jgi:AcrR family transcriptional regulator